MDTPNAWSSVPNMRTGQTLRADGGRTGVIVSAGRSSVTLLTDGGEVTVPVDRSPLALYPVAIHGPKMANGRWSV